MTYSRAVTAGAFLHLGQGSQKVGMGAEVLANHLSDYLAQAEAASGRPIRRICVETPMDPPA